MSPEFHTIRVRLYYSYEEFDLPYIYGIPKIYLNLFNYDKRPLLRCVHHFKSDSINNMDHVRISGIELSSVIRFIARSSKCSTKPLSILPTNLKKKLLLRCIHHFKSEKNCLHILSKVFRSLPKQPSQEERLIRKIIITTS